VRGRIVRELLNMGCYLEEYQAPVGTWAAGLSWRAPQGQASSGNYRCDFGTMLLCAAVLASLLVIGGVEQYPGPGVEEKSIMQVLCSGCDRNLKSGT
jgi:hypothetical protein